MASGSPDGPDKRRKINAGHSRQDQPLFASRLPAPVLQQPPDFLTDSLNTTHIPSPSPPKSPTRQAIHAKPRKALERKSLTAAFRATSDGKDENRLPHFPPPLESNRSRQLKKPNATVKTRHTASPSPTKLSKTSARPRTPTPPRGRQLSVGSPLNSESSPGRGYAEAYQRIVEEENLAHEDSIEDMEHEGYEYSKDELSQDLDRLRQQRSQHSISPTSLRASRRASLNVNEALDERATDDQENMSRDLGSDFSGHDRENATSTSLDSGSSQYARDMQRINGLKSAGKVFSKARLGPKVGLTVENLRRSNGSNESLGSAVSVESVGTRASDPSINVPKAWGRKAKPGREWLSRINSRSGKLTGDVPKRRSSGEEGNGDIEKSNREESIDEWIAAAAEVSSPGHEDPSLQTIPSEESTPTTAAQRPTSSDIRRDWEVNDDEFTGRSLQVSESPPIRIKSSALDLVREREIESLERRAVTTSRLGALGQKKSRDRLRNSQSPEHLPDLDGNRQQRSSRPSSQQSNAWVSGHDPTDVTTEDTGKPIPDTPIVISRTKSNNLVGIQESGTKVTRDGEESRPRPTNHREDSQDLLKRLARATSESPSSMKEQLEYGPTQEPKPNEVDQTPVPSKPTTDRKTPVVTGAWLDQSFKETPHSSMQIGDPKTPFVTGAWVDTPLPTGGRGPPMPSPAVEDPKQLGSGKLGATDLIRRLNPTSNSETSRPNLQPQEPLKYSGPPLPKSALENIINAARSKQSPLQTSQGSDSEEDPTLHLGDSTIQSLEGFIANDTDYSVLAPTTPASHQTPPTSDDPSPVSLPVTSPSARRAEDLESYTHILSRLNHLGPSLRDSKNQLATLERAVSEPSTSTAVTRRRRLQEDPECDEAGELHDFILPCQRCGCPGRMDQPDLSSFFSLRDNVTSIRIPVPRLWTWKRDDWRPRLTWLGVIILTIWTLLWAENWAIDTFCHPLYASSMVGYGVDIHAPRPPFVLAKVIYRNTVIGSVLAPVYHATRILFRAIAGIVGYLTNFVFGTEEGVGNVGGGKLPVSRDQRIPRPSWGPDLSMMDDEFL